MLQRCMRLFGWMYLVCLFCVAGALAQEAVTVPPLVKVSGVLKDNSGQPLTGVTDITFYLYEEQEGGAPLWMERQDLELDAQGRYTAVLGATTGKGLLLELFVTGEAHWLGMQVKGELEERPRILLVSVPFALKAADAETLGGQPASAFVLASEVGSATTAASGSTSLVTDGEPQAPPVVALAMPQAAVMMGTTEFVDNNTTEVVKVEQQGTGFALNAEGPNNGVIGKATQTTGGTFGVRGINLSTGGIALFGDARATTGATFGARGDSASTTGRGRFGFASAASGLTIGVLGVASSAQGTAGVFHNTAGGPILLGRASSVDLFSVDGSGNVTATAFVGDGSGLTGIPSGTVTSVGSGTGLTGGPITTSGDLSFDTTFGDARYAPASAFGDITAVIAGTGLSDGGIMGDVTLNLSPAARVRGITYLAGCDSCTILNRRG